jgi:hypothetical protein
MEIKDIITFIQSIGFPIFVAVYVLIRLEKTLGQINETLKDLVIQLERDNVRISK